MGVKIECDIKYISVAIGGSFNSRGINSGREFKIICEGKDPITASGKEYASASFGNQPIIQIPYSSKVSAYINPSDPNDYWVELPKFSTRLPDFFLGSLQKTFIYYRSYDGKNYSEIK